VGKGGTKKISRYCPQSAAFFSSRVRNSEKKEQKNHFALDIAQAVSPHHAAASTTFFLSNVRAVERTQLLNAESLL
jgi:hypothetical protein